MKHQENYWVFFWLQENYEVHNIVVIIIVNLNSPLLFCFTLNAIVGLILGLYFWITDFIYFFTSQFYLKFFKHLRKRF